MRRIKDPNAKVPMRAKVGYMSFSLADIASGLTSAYLMYYFTTFLGLHIAVVTVVFSIAKIIGTCISPFWGWASDHLYSTKFGRKFGRRKGLLLLGIPLHAIFYLLQWVPGLPIACYFIANLMMSGTSTPMIRVAKESLVAEMTENAGQRAQLVGLNQIGSAVNSLAGSAIILALLMMMDQQAWSTYFILAIIFDVISTVLYLIGYFTCYERPYDESTVLIDEKREKPTPIKNLVSVFYNFLSVIRIKTFRNYLGMFLTEELFRSLRGTTSTYFIIFVLLLEPSMVTLSKVPMQFAGMAFLVFFVWPTSRTNGPFTYRVGGVAAIINFLLIFCLAVFQPEAKALIMMVLLVTLNFGITGIVNATQQTYTYVPDIDEMVTTKRREGQYSGMTSTIDTVFSLLETVVVGFLLSASGFVEGSDVQGPATVQALSILYCIVPCVFIVIGMFFSSRVKVTTTNHKILLAEIARLREGGSMDDVTPETREVVEELTGFKYEDCWGHNSVLDFSDRGGSAPVTQTPAAAAH